MTKPIVCWGAGGAGRRNRNASKKKSFSFLSFFCFEAFRFRSPGSSSYYKPLYLCQSKLLIQRTPQLTVALTKSAPCAMKRQQHVAQRSTRIVHAGASFFWKRISMQQVRYYWASAVLQFNALTPVEQIEGKTFPKINQCKNKKCWKSKGQERNKKWNSRKRLMFNEVNCKDFGIFGPLLNWVRV